MASTLPVESVADKQAFQGLKELARLKEKNHALHPVEGIEHSYETNKRNMRNFMLNNVFGAHMPLRLQMEETILLGLNSHHALSVLHAKDETIGIEDYMNVPKYMEEFPESFRTKMEKRLGLL